MAKSGVAFSLSPIRKIRRSRRFSLLAFLLGVAAFVHALRLLVAYRRSFRAQLFPTDFSSLGVRSDAGALAAFDGLGPGDAIRQLRRETISSAAGDPQYSFVRQLGSGWEGRALLYVHSASGQRVVIKEFSSTKSPFRNCVPSHVRRLFRGAPRWPSEIPTSLSLGGFRPLTANSSDQGLQTTPGHDFLPVYDFFLAGEPGVRADQWRLVTPLIELGTLEDLARRIRSRSPQTVRELDTTYRSSFNRLLSSLETMHSQDLCHDDFKPANVFAVSENTWLIDDMGQVREKTHPYHQSYIWSRSRRWTDCTVMDTFKALNVYLMFLRGACSDPDSFDDALFAGREPWSRLFWRFRSAAESTAALQASSIYKFPPEEPPHYSTVYTHAPTGYWRLSSLFFGKRRVIRDSATRMLTARVHDGWAWVLSFGWLFSVAPKTQHC